MTMERTRSATAEAVLQAMSECVLTMGECIDVAMREERDFDEWVYEHLPFYPTTARRVRAMWLVWQDHPSAELPDPWKALCLLE